MAPFFALCERFDRIIAPNQFHSPRAVHRTTVGNEGSVAIMMTVNTTELTFNPGTPPRPNEPTVLSRYLWCCVLAAAWVVTASASQEPPVKSDQQILIELEQRWNEAFYQKDVAFIEGILADEFIATYDDGSRGDKARELALTTAFDQQVQSAIQDEFTVKVYRDTAVVWFTLRLVGIRQGQRAEVTLHYTDVWVLRDGMWQCVSTQSTKVNPQ